MNWNRKVYFSLERLHISAAERYFMLTLMLLLMGASLIRIWAEPEGNYKPDYYKELHEALRAREQEWRAAERGILMRYGSFGEAGAAAGSNELAAQSGISGTHRLSAKQEIAHALLDSPATATDTIESQGREPSLQPHAGDKNTGNDKQILINKASVDALTQLPGIGPVIAGRIVQYRMEHGPFRSANDLREVKGIGEKRLENILPYIKL